MNLKLTNLDSIALNIIEYSRVLLNSEKKKSNKYSFSEFSSTKTSKTKSIIVICNKYYTTIAFTIACNVFIFYHRYFRCNVRIVKLAMLSVYMCLLLD